MTPVKNFVTWILPTGLRVFAFPQPLSDLDGRLKLGLCMMLERDQSEPGHFVCNVGHIPGPCLQDQMLTVASSFDIMEELSGDATGLVANVLCLVPETDPARCF